MFHYFWATDRQVDYVKFQKDGIFSALCTILGGREFCYLYSIERNEVPFDLPIGGWHYSPDGRYLLYFDSNEKGSRRALYDLFANPVVLKEYRDPIPTFKPRILWLPDSKHWAEITYREVPKSTSPRDIVMNLRIRSTQDDSERTISIRGDIADATPAGIAQDGTLVLHVEHEAVVSVDLNAPSRSPKRLGTSLPMPIERAMVDFRPVRNRLLWTVVVQPRPNVPLLFPIAYPKEQVEGMSWVVYYTTQLDGSHLTAIGTCLFVPPEGVFHWDMVKGRWFPDGKSFSFYYDGELYRYTLK